MRIQITGGGIFGLPTEENPSGELPIGAVLTLDKEPTGWAGRYTVISGGGEGEQTPVVNPAGGQGGERVATYEARAKEDAPGWYQVYDAEGVAVGKAMRQADADAFNALSDEDKAEFVKAED